MSSTDRDSTRRSFVPILSLAAGMLIGGVVFAWSGALIGDEWITCLLAAAGMTSGAITGGYLGTRWHLSRDHPPDRH